MPTYQYHCAANGRSLEVKHRMSETLSTWGELCTAAGLASDGTPADSPIAKVLAPTFVDSEKQPTQLENTKKRTKQKAF